MYVLLIVNRPIHTQFLTYAQKVSARENVGIGTIMAKTFNHYNSFINQFCKSVVHIRDNVLMHIAPLSE